MEINSSVLKLDMLLVNLSQTVSRKTQQKAANALKVVANLLQNTAKRLKTQQMRLRLSPIHRKTPQNNAKRSKCTQDHRQFTPKRRKNSNYTRDSESQDSNDQKSNHENGNENEKRGLHGNMQGRGQWEWKSTVQF